MKKGGFMKDALILCIITLIAGGCLGGVYEVTKEPIEQAKMAAKAAAYKLVLPEAASFEAGDTADLITQGNEAITGLGYGNVLVDECATGLDAGGNVVGHVVTATSKDGYGGAIKLSVGVSQDGTVVGVEFLDLPETVGFGKNAESPEWKGQYAAKNADAFKIVPMGAAEANEINAISGATVTSNAVNGAVNAAVYFAKNCLTQ